LLGARESAQSVCYIAECEATSLTRLRTALRENIEAAEGYPIMQAVIRSGGWHRGGHFPTVVDESPR
jgi:hypothetical protein